MKTPVAAVLAFIVGAALMYVAVAPQKAPEEGVTLGGPNTTYIKNPHVFERAVTLENAVTVSGGTFDVTTANTATSTIIGGCYQFYATSTATAHKFQASTTPGIMYSQYGTCPNL